MELITVNEAKDVIRKNVSPLKDIILPIEQAWGYVLSEDIISEINIPSFRQSAMDGFAFRYAADPCNISWQIRGTIAAGSQINIALRDDEAVKIFTGAEVPDTADTIVMVEKTSVTDNRLTIDGDLISKGDHIRDVGSEIQKGDLALSCGSILTPAAVGFLASLGISRVRVKSKPAVAIIVTGNELQTPGTPLLKGQVYESNSFTLMAALQQIGIKTDMVKIHKAPDELDHLVDTLKKAMEEADMILLTGGISAGDYDYVLAATQACGIRQLFYKVKQKPGKPLYCGRQNEKIVFGLPGNPASVLTCFYLYVTLAIDLMTGTNNRPVTSVSKLANPYHKKSGFTHFLKGMINGSEVNILGSQESYKLQSFSRANCLIEIPDSETDLCPGDMVRVHITN